MTTTKRYFVLSVAGHLTGWLIVRAFLDRLARAYLNTDSWEDEKKDIAVKVVAELESIKPGEDLQLHGPAVKNIADAIYKALLGSSFILVRRSPGGHEHGVTQAEFIDACRFGFETVIAEARAK